MIATVWFLGRRKPRWVAAVGLFDRHTVADPARSSLAVWLRLHLLRLQLRMIVAVRGL